MIIFDRYLCCISLKTFGKFYGWLCGMFAILFAYVRFIVITIVARQLVVNREMTLGLVLIELLILVMLLVWGFVHFGLVYGVKKHKSSFIIPYFILCTIIAVINICQIKLYLDVAASFPSLSKYSRIIAATVYIISSIYVIYHTLCVYSLFQIIKLEEKRRKSYLNDNHSVIYVVRA